MTFRVMTDEICFSKHETLEEAKEKIEEEKRRTASRVKGLRDEIASEQEFVDSLTIKEVES